MPSLLCFYYTIFGLKMLLTPKTSAGLRLFFYFDVKIVDMDKIIKTISESGAFRAYVLDMYRNRTNSQRIPSDTNKFNGGPWRTLIASQILAANERETPR